MTTIKNDDHWRADRHVTQYEMAHIRRLATGLQEILGTEHLRQLPLQVCCGVVGAGCGLSRHESGDRVFFMGKPWSTWAALRFLSGRGFVLDPRVALAALNRLEARYIIDRRRMTYRDAPPRERVKLRVLSTLRVRTGRGASPFGEGGARLMMDGRYALGYVDLRPSHRQR